MSETILEQLARLFPQASKTTLREMVAAKRVTINGNPAKSLKQPLNPRDKLKVEDFGVSTTPGGTATNASNKPQMLAEKVQLLYQDADIIIVDKPAGVLTSTNKKEHRPTVLAILNTYVKKTNHRATALLVHRLDRDASGLLVFARNQSAYASLKQQFFEHTITRRYDAIVHGTPQRPAAKLEHLLQQNSKTGKVFVSVDAKNAKKAILNYHTIASGRERSHLQCELFTGRKHQIRVQLKAIGHPVCGDGNYGNPDEPPNRLALHASFLQISHPRTNKPIQFTSPMPPNWKHLIGK